MAHDHPDHVQDARGSALFVAWVANTVLLAVQVVGGVVFGSLALLADSVHQASDVVALMVAIGAARFAARPAAAHWTYGRRRAEVFGGAVNGGLLLAGSAAILLETIGRLGEETEIVGGGVIVLALVGIAVNGLSAIRLARVAGDNLNLRGATAHLTADAAGSVGVLLSGLAVVLAGWTWVDLAVSFVLAIVVAYSAVRLLRTAWRILLEAAPRSVDLGELEASIADRPDVVGVHHLHVWSLDSETLALTAHVQVERQDLHGAQELADEISRSLLTRGIEHATLQVECHDCERGSNH